eukprot:CAMPEP_0115258792 /NCGR_PEP_ID=MMETSP0270-20121206/47483_1 /TAXON_ID=71861 /ORGANISM="Scrippsiella trochoidea, Strain CCMP3099" /LENGTH=614 /DNA_ID=CAMNT_0002674565 /DNA_START=39 /DNA_END=1883 /DNA_ORIENTATION=+
MAFTEGMDMELAVALFERGFSEARVEQALSHCSTLDAALRWLSSGSAESGAECSAGSRGEKEVLAAALPLSLPAVAAEMVDASEAATAAAAPRRRTMRKGPDAAEFTAKEVSSAATAMQAVSLCMELPRVGTSSSLVTATADTVTPGYDAESSNDTCSVAGATSTSASSSSAPVMISSIPVGSCGMGLAIEARDASSWWSNAAAVWQKNTCALKRERSDEALGSASVAAEESQQDEADDVQEAETPVLERESIEAETETMSAGNACAVEASKVAVLRPCEDDEGAEPMLHRLPATPCSVARPKAVADMPVETSQSMEPSGMEYQKSIPLEMCSPAAGKKMPPRTPTSSPRGMRLNNKEELCGICCNDVPACRAVRLGCSHGWYCAQCVLRHAEARLAAGATSITCPECCTPLAERDLRKLLPSELIDRLLSRSLEKAVATASDLWSCPTPNCPMRVALEEGELPRLKCTICNKTSCLKCGVQPWHRGLTCEQSRAKRGAETGKRKRDDGMASLMKWIQKTGTKQCPTCNMAVTKQNIDKQRTQYQECHKMCCRNCNTRFCFKCLAVLTDSYTCGCTINAHGFIDPHSGKRLNHLRRGRAKAKAAAKRQVGRPRK